MKNVHDQYLRTKVFDNLDGLRALAIIAVVWHHAMQTAPSTPLLGRGFLGVDLFFTLSGFLITTLLLREKSRTGEVQFLPFFLRRALRIIPAYVLMLVLVIVATMVSKGSHHEHVLMDLLYAATFTANLVPMASMLSITWSLAVEQQFYLMLPWVEKLRSHVVGIVLGTAIVLSMLPPLGLGMEGLPHFFRETTFLPILLGAVMAHLLHAPSSFAWIHRQFQGRAMRWWSVGLIAASCNLPHDDISGWPRFLIQFSLALGVLICVLPATGGPIGWLNGPVLRRIGVVSYGIYLYHLLGMEAFRRLTGRLGLESDLLLAIGTLAVTWVLAEISYRWWETPFLRMKLRVAKPRPRVPRDTDFHHTGAAV